MRSDVATIVDSAVTRYRRELDRYRKFALHVGETLQVSMRTRGILATVQWRAKHPESLRGKLCRSSRLGTFRTADDALESVLDLAAVRVCTYRHTDRARALDVAGELFAVAPGSIDVKDDSRRQRSDYSKWYRATHMQLGIRTERVTPELENLVGDTCEVQISSPLQHSWNEVEHDIGYKPSADPSSEVTGLLDKLGQWCQEGDELIDKLMHAHERFSQSIQQRSITEYSDFFADAEARLRQHSRLDAADEELIALHEAIVRSGLTLSGHLWDQARPELYVLAESLITPINERLLRNEETRDLLSFGSLILVAQSPSDRLFVALLPAIAERLANLADQRHAIVARAYLDLVHET